MRESRRARTAWVILLVSLLVVTGACVSVDDAASGREIYEQICARCHGASLEGGVGPALGPESEAAGRDDVYWTQTISRGRGRMPAFRSTLTDDQIQRVIDYAREVQGR